jgi:hypothetical protein
MTREQIRELVERYALACNAQMEFERSNIMDLYQQLHRCYLDGQGDIVNAAIQELVSSDELPEPVRSYWREFTTKAQEAKTMPKNITWTMNCILFGAKVIKLIKEGDRQKAIEEIKNLSSEFDDSSANYLVVRLQELL